MIPVGAFGLPEAVAAILAIALNAYVLLGGADFGGGVWDLLASGPRRQEQRALIAKAIGPIWEANHVWLIVVVVVLFTAFPAAFSALSIVLHIPLTVVLLGIVLRSSAFVFRSYAGAGAEVERRWGRLFATASTVTPLFLGIAVGAVASGEVGARVLRMQSGAGDAFIAAFVRPWLAPFPLAVGAMTVALVAFLAAVYSILATAEESLREDFRRRALMAGGALIVSALGAFLLAHSGAPRVKWGLTSSPWSIPFQVATGVSAAVALGALWTRRWTVARGAAGALVSLILWGWVLAQFPYLVPDAITIRGAAAPRTTLLALIGILAAGGLVLVPSLIYLFRTFADTRTTRTSRMAAEKERTRG
jgi:cytochrome d ubiquinol oxidase subunit II